MDDYGIKPEWREAWLRVEKFRQHAGPCYVDEKLADLAVGLLAGWMRERFEREHREWNHEFRSGCIGCKGHIDPRHNFQDADWLRVAREELGKLTHRL